MADLYEVDYATAYYRSNDPMKKFKIRVRLERATSSNVLLPVSQSDGSHNNDVSVCVSRDYEEIELHWQQKVFSQREVELYKDGNKCANIIEEKYSKDINNLLCKGPVTTRIFTYVDHDDCRHLLEDVQYVTNSNKEVPTILSQKMSNVRRRRVAGRKTQDHPGVPKVNIVDLTPSLDHMNRTHLSSPSLQAMYIMADLSPHDRPATIEDEVVLCCIQLSSKGVISVRPDFNPNRKSYTAETLVKGAEVYEYSVENISQVMSRQDKDRELKMYSELYTRHTEFLQACVGNEFDMPPQDVTKMMVYGEIVSAKNFEYDNLYIHCFVNLTKGWHVSAHQQMSWVTQICRTKAQGNDDVAYFSFPFNLELHYKKQYQTENKDELPGLPMLLIEVLSLDTWSRFRTEGYTYIHIPCHPGKYKKHLWCWRPIGNRRTAELRRFFIGGSPELEDLTYTAIPNTFDGTHISKYGFRTETTGQISVNLNVMLQSRSFLEQHASKKSLGTLVDALGLSTVQANIANVLEAFKKAREKMLQARDNAALDLLKDPTN